MQPCILLTGQLRDENLLLTTLTQCRALKEAGLIEQIYLSTWIGQIAADSSVRALLQVSGAVLIESPEPTNLAARGNFFHQVKATRLVLDHLPDSQRVLKTRTDVLFEDINDLQRLLLCDLTIDSGLPVSGPFSNRIWTPFYYTEVPFLMSDLVLVGSAGDLRKLYLADARVETDGFHYFSNGKLKRPALQHLMPELRFFLHPFEPIFPVLRTYREVFLWHVGHSDFLGFSLKSKWYWRYMSLYYFILLSYFRIGRDVVQGRVWAVARHLTGGNEPKPTFVLPRASIDRSAFSANWIREFPAEWHRDVGSLFDDSSEWLMKVFRGEIDDPDINELLFPALGRAMAFDDRTSKEFEEYRDELIRRLGPTDENQQVA